MIEYIEREVTIANSCEYNLGGSYYNTVRAVPVDAIKAIPAANVRPVVYAHPVKFFNDPWTGKMFTSCSACGGKIGPKDNFCKHCGANMKEVETHD